MSFYLFFVGKSGKWKDHFTVSDNERFDKHFAEFMQDLRLDITFE
jgi:hypothetical protein